VKGEKLATDVLDHLLHDRPASAGKAFKAAVNDYLGGQQRCDAKDNAVLAMTTLYGIPNYRQPQEGSVTMSSHAQQLIAGQKAAWPAWRSTPASANLQRQVRLNMTGWTLNPAGVVNIPNVAYLSSLNAPILPVISLKELFPSGSEISNVVWNASGSTSLELTNDIPLPMLATTDPSGNDVITETGVFTMTGFYPATLFFTSTISAVGGGTELRLQVLPVQYDRTTHTTRIWTELSFDVTYSVPASSDSDEDGLPDYWEQNYDLDPYNDSGDSGSAMDVDHDGLTNLQEYGYGTNPRRYDTDGDQGADGIEVILGTDPNNYFSRPYPVCLPAVLKGY
jgi:hypothetical protein